MQEVARTMFGVGSVITHSSDPTRILILKRSAVHSDFNQEKWELLYGRKHPLEEVTDALRREASEELGISDLDIVHPLRLWHFFRGERAPEKEIIGVTFLCTTQMSQPTISIEHSEYRWVTPDEALRLVSVPGIRQDIEIFSAQTYKRSFSLSDTLGTLTRYAHI